MQQLRENQSGGVVISITTTMTSTYHSYVANKFRVFLSVASDKFVPKERTQSKMWVVGAGLKKNSQNALALQHDRDLHKHKIRKSFLPNQC